MKVKTMLMSSNRKSQCKYRFYRKQAKNLLKRFSEILKLTAWP